MRVIIFGGAGYIGSEFCRQMYSRGIDYIKVPSRGWTSVGELRYIVKNWSPNVIINSAAYVGENSIKDCEQNKDQTIVSNVVFVKTLIDICTDNNIILGHMSSGCVYNGYIDGGYKETDVPNLSFKNNNCSFYTGTKVLAEDLLKTIQNKYVWRIRLPFDEVNNRRNYLTKILSYDKLVSAPNSLSHRTELVTACIDSFMNEVPYGVYNVTNPGWIDSYNIVLQMKKHMRLGDWMPHKTFNFFSSVDEFNALDSMPRSNTILNTEKLSLVGIKMRDVNQSIEETLKQWRWS